MQYAMPTLAPRPKINDTKLSVGGHYTDSQGEAIVFIGENPHAKEYPMIFSYLETGEVVGFTRALYRKNEDGEHISVLEFKKPRVVEEKWFNVYNGEIHPRSYKSREWADNMAKDDRTNCFGLRIIVELHDGKWQIMSKEFLE